MQKSKTKILICMIAAIALLVCGCQNVEPSEATVSAKQSSITLSSAEVASFDYTSLFTVVCGENVQVTTAMLDLSQVSENATSFEVTCSYEGKSATVRINVSRSIVEDVWAVEYADQNTTSVTVSESEVGSVDFKKYFKVTKNGEEAQITDEMVSSDVVAIKGNYTFSVTAGGKTLSLSVVVEEDAPAEDVWTVEYADPQVVSVEIYPRDVDFFNYRKYFVVKKNGFEVGTSSSMITNDVLAEEGTYSYTVTAPNGASKTLTVVVLNPYSVELSATEISLRALATETYDFNALFTVTENGVAVEITSDMVQSDIEARLGDFTYTVTFHGVSKTLAVHVSDDYEIVVIPSYKTLSVALSEAKTFDVTMLFSLYIDGEAAEVTSDMIDSPLQNAEVGQTYEVLFNYSKGSSKAQSSVLVTIEEDAATEVKTQNIVTYPNSGILDLTTLFSITEGTKTISVTNEMIRGTVDYSLEDVAQEIVLTYREKQYISTVTVKRGVVISYATSDVINIEVGTDKSSYLFADDFVVLVNGVRFRNITNFLDVSAVNFDEVGQYEATLNILYNNKTSGLSGPKMEENKKTIVYNVVPTEYTLDVLEEIVSLPVGTTEYDVFQNLVLKVKLNGSFRQISVGNNVSWINSVYRYAEVVSDPLDFSDDESQKVEIDIYVNCAKAGSNLGEPVRVVYYVRVLGGSDIEVIGADTVIFGNKTLFATDLFTVTENGEQIPVTQDMVSGKVDTFRAGIYTVTAEYKGVFATATVVVIDPEMAGTYKTGQKTIPTEEEEDGDEDGGGTSYWEDESTQTEVTYSATSSIGNLVITSDGNITVHGVEATIVGATDERTLVILLGTNKYTLYYDNGIVVLDPENSLKMGFTEDRRPLLYFDTSAWTIDKILTVNYGSAYVLSATNIGYSFDIVHVTSADQNTSMWYALRTKLETRTSSDTIYVVSWGEVTFAEGFVPQTGVSSSLVFDGISVKFAMTDDSIGKIDHSDEEKIWNGMEFSGQFDGSAAKLTFDKNENVSLIVNGNQIFHLGQYDYSQMKNGGLDHASETVFVYDFDDDPDDTEEKEVFSYKFALNVADKTFTLLQRDGIYGQYLAEGMYVFLDGYGTGIASFDTSTYETAQFQYTLINNEVKITFFNTSSTFEFGKYVTFNLADLKNVLTVKETQNSSLTGIVFTNGTITDGAIVSFTKSVFNGGSSSYKEDIYESIVIQTKDGFLTTEQKKAKLTGTTVQCVNLSAVSNKYDGFYQIAVSVLVDGTPVTGYYAVQIQKTSSATLFSQLFGNANLRDNYILDAVLNFADYSVTLDNYGNATVILGTNVYNGYCLVDTENAKFTLKAFSDDSSVLLSGASLQSGLFKVTCSGAASFTDYFFVNSLGSETAQTAGCEDNVLRKITTQNTIVYIYAVSEKSLGEIVTVTQESDGACVVTKANGESFAAKVVWGDEVGKGLTLSDGLRGTYVCAGEESLILDGFGNAVWGSAKGTYVASGVYITFNSTAVSAFCVNKTEGTYRAVSFNIANSVSGKKFTATFAVSDGSSQYSVTATITFSDGTVTIAATSDDYSESGGFQPAFVGVGTFEITSDGKIKIKINGETFAFTVPNVIEYNSIVCQSTSLSSDAVGYFDVGTTFSAE